MTVIAKSMVDLPRYGIILMLGAWLIFSWVDTGAKWLAVAGIPAFQLAFMRYAGHFVISIAVIAKGGFKLDRFKTRHLCQVISRALLLVSATLSNFYALQFLPLTVVSAIMFSSPVVVCFLSVSILREEVGPWRWSAILLGFIGVLIVVRPFGTTFHPAMLMIIYNAIALALYSLMTRRLSGIVAVETMQFYMGLVGTLLMLPFAIWVWTQPATTWGMLVLISLGVLGWASTFDKCTPLWDGKPAYAVHLFISGICGDLGIPIIWNSARCGHNFWCYRHYERWAHYLEKRT
jgi:drug/metabolite transporter (DMT)-like permease